MYNFGMKKKLSTSVIGLSYRRQKQTGVCVVNVLSSMALYFIIIKNQKRKYIGE